jgi:hypothetical protein
MKRSTLEQFAEDEQQQTLFKKAKTPDVEPLDKMTIVLQRGKMGWEATSEEMAWPGLGQTPMEAIQNLIEPAAWDDHEREHRKMGGGPIPQPEYPKPPW